MPTDYSIPGIIYATDYGMKANIKTYVQAQANAVALQTAIAEAQASCASLHHSGYGAVVVIPSNDVVPSESDDGAGGTYYLACPDEQDYAVQVECHWPLLITGTSNGTKLVMIGDEEAPTKNMFEVSVLSPGDDDIGGLTFQDLQIAYDDEHEGAAGVAIYVGPNLSESSPAGSGQNIRVFRCVFLECPTAVWFNASYQSSMIDCFANYGGPRTTPNPCIQIGGTISGKGAQDVRITTCLFTSNNFGTGIVVQGSDQLRITDTKLNGFTYGMKIEPGPDGFNAVHHTFTALTIYVGATGDASTEAGTALTIAPQGSGQPVGQITFQGCIFEPGSSLMSSQGAGIVIEEYPDGGVIDTVRFVSCYSCRWSGPGIQINSGNNVEILGGMYAGNNLGEGGAQPYGIYVGAATNVRIIGASCVGQFTDITEFDDGASPPQKVGIFVDSGATNVIVEGCDLTGNSENGVYVNGSSPLPTDVFIRDCSLTGYSLFSDAVHVATGVTSVQITNCSGYNDVGTQLASVIPVTATTFRNYTYGYFGPVEFYTAPKTSTIREILVDGVVTELTQGSFLLIPGETASIHWTTGLTLPSFVMITK